MKITVCLKYVPDLDSVDVDPITGVVDESRLLYLMNPADEGALELALRLVGDEGQVQVLTVGPEGHEDGLRTALAAGAHEVTRLWDPNRSGTEPFYTAAMLSAAIKASINKAALPDFVLCGTRSDDHGSGLVPALLAEQLGWPVVVDVTEFDIQDGQAIVQRRASRGAREEVIVQLPAVLALEPDLARLRHASLFGVMNARRATIPVLNSTQLALNLPTMPTLSRTIRPQRPRTRAIFMPDSTLPAHERVQQIISAGVTRDSGRILEGPPDKMAEAIIEFLAQRGFI